jgi:acyl carrier protein
MQADTTILNDVLRIVAYVLASSERYCVDECPVDVDTDLREVLGFDSLAMMHVLSSAEEEFGVLLDDDEAVASTRSVRTLATCIRRRTEK